MQDTQKAPWLNLGYSIEVVKENGMYKYRARNFKNLKEAQVAKRKIQAKGFSDAFLVAFKDGKRIPLETALKELGL